LSPDLEVSTLEVDLDISIADDQGLSLPQKNLLVDWITATLVGADYTAKYNKPTATVSMRVVNDQEIAELNHKYRHIDKPTNILSFPFEPLPDVDVSLLGDIVVCAKIIQDEAMQQSKSIEQHWAHIVVHGVLHLLGYEHQEEQQAEKMESLEIDILSKFGFPNPYGELNVP
jgi:probable rRNA maturation factor